MTSSKATATVEQSNVVCVVLVFFGIALIAIGVTLELVLYPVWMDTIQDSLPVVIDGWTLSLVGLPFLTFLVALFDKRYVLRIGPDGIFAPRHGVRIPSTEIRNVQLLTSEKGGIVGVAVAVYDASRIIGSEKQKKRYKVEPKLEDEDTIPFGLLFLKYDPDALAAAITHLNAGVSTGKT